jgi:chromosome segregation ATPase
MRLVAVLILLSSCASKDSLTKLQEENDSLKRELSNSQEMLFAFKEVGSLIDSIDDTRKALRVNVIEGTTVSNYTERLSEINQYVKKSGERINDLEARIRTYNTQSEAYQMLIATLKDELTIVINELNVMEDRVNKVITQNTDGNQKLKLQQLNLEDFQLQLDAKYEEVKLFEIQIQELTEKLQITEADALFAQAQALELAARRTKLAPVKKRDTFRQALALYEKASEAGNPLAAAKIKEIKKRV